MKNFKEWLFLKEDETTKKVPEDQRELSDYVIRNGDPDTIYSKDSITFIYDTKNNKLYFRRYPKTHEDMLNSTPDYKQYDDWIEKKLLDQKAPDINFTTIGELMGLERFQRDREGAIWHGHLLGRVGNWKGNDLISFWNRRIDDEAKFNQCLEALVRQFPYLHNNRKKVIVATDLSKAFQPFFLKDAKIDFKSIQPDKNKESQSKSNCFQKATVDIDGKPTKLFQIMGNLHMVKGNDLDKMKAAFCSNKNQLINSFKQHGCHDELELLNYLSQRSGCTDDNQKFYQQVHSAGKFDRFQSLQKTFSNPQTIDMSRELPLFHRQKDIDNAWDTLQKYRKEHTLEFRDWLNERYK